MKLTIFSIFMVVLVFALMPWTYAQEPSSLAGGDTPLKEVGNLLIGRWMSEITWAVDYPGIGKKGEKVTGYTVYRWIADGTAIECEWYAGKTTGKVLWGWDASSKQIKIFGLDSGGRWDEGTISKQGSKFVGTSAGSFMDGQRVDYKWEMTFQDDGNTLIETGATILAGVRNEFRDVFKRVAK